MRRSPSEAVGEAVAALAGGGMVVVADEADREDEADLIVPAATVTAEQMAFVVSHTSGIICAPMSEQRAEALRLPPMVAVNTDIQSTAFTVTVDHISTGTGVSAADRAASARALSDSATTPEQLRRPGHLFPLRARDGGVLVRAGHTEAAVDLLGMAGAGDVGVISELVAADGTMLRGDALHDFAAAHDLPVLRIADLIRHRGATERLVHPVATSAMPTAFGDFRAIAYRSVLDGTEHLALVMGDVVAAGRSAAGALVRVHSECLTGDMLSSLRCDCGAQLEGALQAIAAAGAGAVIYLRGQEGRGIGLAHKIRAYALQEQGLDTLDANTAQGLPVDSRSYGIGAQIVEDLGIRRLALITNNPAKYTGLDGHAFQIVSRLHLPTTPTPHNVRYLRTKRDRLGHLLPPTLAPEAT